MEELRSLVNRARSDDLDAYGEIVRRFQDMAYGYAYSILGDFHLAEDAAQEAFIEAYRCLPDLREPRAFPGWFRRIVFKHCDRLTRGRSVSVTPLERAADLRAPEPGPAAEAERRELREAVLAAVRALPETERTVTTLFYINGYSQRDIAEFLEVPVTTINNRLHASRRRLKERMVAMVRDEFEEHSLPEDFTQRVVTLAEITKVGVGGHFLFEFAKGVRVSTRVDEVIQAFREDGPLLLLVCGPTDITYMCRFNEERHLHLDSHVLIPSAVISVTAKANAKLKHVSASYEIVAPEEPRHHEKVSYASLPTATGAFDLAPDGAFGFVRLSEEQRPHPYRDPDGEEHSFHSAPDDVYVSFHLIRRYGLRKGNEVTCTYRRKIGNERFNSAVDVVTVNGDTPTTHEA